MLTGVLLSATLAIPGLTSLPALAAPAAFYVSTSGSDEAPGTEARPFLTPQRAQQAVRDLKARGGLPEGGITVWLRGGAYRMEGSLELTEEDSGAPGSPVTYRGYPGERARLVGGIVVPPDSLQPVTDAAVRARLEPSAAEHILQADLTALGLTDPGAPWPLTFRGYAGWPELFFDGRPLTLARWPNEGFARVAAVVDSGSKPRWNEKPDRPGKFTYEGDRPSRWLQAEEVYLNGYWCFKWFNECIKVAAIDPQDKSITFAAPHVYGVGGPSGGEFFALNLLEELDAPGEFYLDRKSGMLYLWPPEDPAGKEIGLSLLETPLVSLQDCSHVVLRDLTLECSRGLAATIRGGKGNLIAGCTIRNLATDAVRIDGGTDNGITGCDLQDLGGAGISLSGGDRATLTPCGNYATNNHLHHWGRLFRTHRDAIYLGGVGCRAAHNLMHHAPHHAMDFSGNDHLVELNEVHHVCLESDDAGAIYTGRDWTVQGNVIRHNFFHHIGGGPAVGNQAIYLDDTAPGTTCFGNVIYRVYRAFLIGGGRDNVAENNLIVDCTIPLHIDNRGISMVADNEENYDTIKTRMAGVPYLEEPWRTRYPRLADVMDDEPGAPKRNVVRNNVIYGCGPMHLANEARAQGIFEGNWETTDDPGLVNAAHLDFSLKPDAAAYRHVPGFEPIPFDQIGLHRDEYRQSLPASEPWIEPAGTGFLGEVEVSIGSRTGGAEIRYTLDGSEPTVQSRLYTGEVKLTETTVVRAAAFMPGQGEEGCSATVQETFTAARPGPDGGIHLSDLQPGDSLIHGGLKKDCNYTGGPLVIGEVAFAKGLTTHTKAAAEGGRSFVTYPLKTGLAGATRFSAQVGIEDSAGKEGSVVFIVELLRRGTWERVYESPVIRSGQEGVPVAVDVDITGAEALRLATTDAGDGINSDHAAWGNARVR